MNTLQITFKKAFDHSVSFLSRHIQKVMPFQPDGMSYESLGHLISDSENTSSNMPKPEPCDKTSNSDQLLSFEKGLNSIDTDMYTPFMMHIEGYKNCEIADYLSLSEKEVAMTISKVRDFLKTHKSTVSN